MVKFKKGTQAQLVADLKRVAKDCDTVTRNHYRAHGKYTESVWQAQFATFREFALAAGVKTEVSKPVTPDFTSEVTGNTWNLSLPKTRIHTLEELLDFCEVDLSIWEVERFTAKAWEMGYKDADGKGDHYPLYAVSATFKRRVEVVEAIAELARLKEDAKAAAHTPKAVIRRLVKSGKLLEVSLFDAHFGKMAWPKETGGIPYDTTIAEHMYLRALDALIERSKGFEYEGIVFPIGNDLLNADDLEGRTTAGTFVSSDGRFYKTFTTVRRVITESIERLRKLAPVKVIVVQGNHDRVSSWCLGDSLECWFHNYSDVEIDNNPTTRKYHQYGQNMLMFCHGDKGNRNGYPLLMATEKPEMFGATKFREAHTGHLHKTKLDEQNGVRVRILPSLSPADSWHSENGFVGNQRNAEAYVWDREEGLVAQFYYNDDAQPEIVTKRTVV